MGENTEETQELDEKLTPDSSTGDEGTPEGGTGGEPSPDTTAEGKSPADDDAGEHRSKGAERRIKQLTARWRAEQERNEELAKRLDALEKRIGPTPEPQRPVRYDFETDEEYEDALFDWRDSVTAVRASTKPEKEPSKPDANGIDPAAAAAFQAKIRELGQDTYDAVFMDDWPCSIAMSQYMIDSDRGTELAVMLADDWDQAARINALPQAAAVRELAKLEAALPAAKPGAVRQPLAPPVSPGKPAGSPVVDEDQLSTDEWVKRRREQMRKRTA